MLINMPNKITQIKILAIKVDVPNFNIATMWTLIIEWYVNRCGSKNKHPKDMYLIKIGMHVQNLLIILDQ
jgi:hypothetical protein